jgi:AAA domain
VAVPLKLTLPRQPEFLIDMILPSREVHILGGMSGAGKTRWILKTLVAWTAGESILGFDSHPVPYAYISGDRSAASVERTCQDIGIPYKDIPFIPIRDLSAKSKQKLTLEFLYRRIQEEQPRAQLIIIEGIARFVAGGKTNDYTAVADFLAGLGGFCTETDRTIIGVCHTAKAKEDAWYEHPREKLLGSGAWGGYSETILFIDTVSKDVTAKGRKLYVLPRTRLGNFTVNCFFDERGRVIEKGVIDHVGPRTTSEGKIRESEENTLINFYIDSCVSSGLDSFTTEEIKTALVETEKLSRATVTRRLKELCDLGSLRREGKGRYKIVEVMSFEQFTGIRLR